MFWLGLVRLSFGYGFCAGAFMGFLVTALFLPLWAAAILVPVGAVAGLIVHDYCESHSVW